MAVSYTVIVPGDAPIGPFGSEATAERAAEDARAEWSASDLTDEYGWPVVDPESIYVQRLERV